MSEELTSDGAAPVLDEDLERLRSDLDPWLPVATLAREAALWWLEEDGVRTLATFPFGTSAA